jgi:glycogen synthase
LHWDQLAVAAYQCGWVVGTGNNKNKDGNDKNVTTTTTVSRAASREALQRHYNGMGMSKLGNSAASKQQNLHWDQLAVAAYQRGWMMNDNRTTTVSRAAAREALQRHYSGIGMSKLGDFNVTCLSPTNTALMLNHCLIYEYEKAPELFHSKRGESQIHR